MTDKDCLSIYEKAAVIAFNELSRLKAQRKVLDAEIRDAEGRLSKSLAQGDLKLWQDPENKNTFRYDGVCYVFCPGRVTYDYSLCEDVVAERTPQGGQEHSSRNQFGQRKTRQTLLVYLRFALT